MRFHYPVVLSRGACSSGGRGLIGTYRSVTLTLMSDEAQEILRGVIERITYHNEENGYTVAKMAPENPSPHLPHWGEGNTGRGYHGRRQCGGSG